jgi:hypothetical protein
MILFYTGADAANAPQINAEKSLGGFVSGSPIPNGKLNNLFSSISKSAVLGNKTEIRMIALKNLTGSTVSNLSIYTNTVGKSAKLQLAAVAPMLDSSNNPLFEQLYDNDSLPFQATLNYHEGAENAILIDTFAANQVIGIWMLREINTDAFPELQNTSNLTTDQLVSLLESNKPIHRKVLN